MFTSDPYVRSFLEVTLLPNPTLILMRKNSKHFKMQGHSLFPRRFSQLVGFRRGYRNSASGEGNPVQIDDKDHSEGRRVKFGIPLRDLNKKRERQYEKTEVIGLNGFCVWYNLDTNHGNLTLRRHFHQALVWCCLSNNVDKFNINFKQKCFKHRYTFYFTS